MTSQLQRHNPLALPAEPDFTNDLGVKWWGIDIGQAVDGTAVYVVVPDGNRDYLILKDDEIIFGTKNLEALAYHFTVLELVRKRSGQTRDGETNDTIVSSPSTDPRELDRLEVNDHSNEGVRGGSRAGDAE